MTSITSALGSGSGIDLTALVTSLVDNQFAVKTATLKSRETALTAQISGVATLKNAISGFSTALTNLTKNGTLTTAPTSSNTGVAKLTALTGKTVGNLSATLDVVQLAKPQSVASGVIADRSASIGTGRFSLTFGQANVSNGAMTGFTPGAGTPIAIDIPAGQDNLTGIAAAINAAKAGVTASIVSDSGGSRLVLKGATGASQGFTLESSDPGLSDLNIAVGATGTSIGSVAQDAIVKLDGVELRRASNTVLNLIDDARLELTSVGTTTLGTAAPTVALTQAVGDLAATYNEVLALLKEQTDAKTGPLRADPAAQALLRSMQRLPLTQLSSDASGPRTLAEIGIATNRDGTLRVDSSVLNRALSTNGKAVEAMFADSAGIASVLSAIATSATSAKTGLGGSDARYAKAKSDLSLAQEKAVSDADAMRTRLTSQFAAMDARVAAYKATGSFLTNQIAAWNKSD